MAVKVGIRADGGQKVGMGHLMRCLSLAHEFKSSGHEVFFISHQDSGVDLLNMQGFRVQILEESSYPEQDLPQLYSILNNEEASALIIDSYAVSTEYLGRLRQVLHPMVYIDDINAFPYPADIVVNGNVNAHDLGYIKYRPEQILLLGAGYNLLRSQFRNLPHRQVNQQISDILLTTGGSDPCNLTPQLTTWLLQLPGKRIYIVAGAGFGDIGDLVDLHDKYPERVKIYQKLTDLSPLMLKADLAISSGGSTLYELCSAGTPTLAFIMAENQLGIADWLNREGYIASLGWYQHISDRQLTDAVTEIEQDVSRRQQMAQRGQQLIDGNGPARVMQAILKAIINKEARL